MQVFHVKHNSLRIFLQFLDQEAISLTDTQKSKLETYRNLLYEWSAKINLISRGDRDFIVERHFYACMYFVKLILQTDIKKGQRILDLGTGAGLPGIFLSIFFKNEVTLLDSSRKKTLFLHKVIDQLQLESNIIHDRIEYLDKTFMKKYKIITARAVSNLGNLTKWTRHLLEEKGLLITVKGDDYRNEFLPDSKEKFDITEYPVDKTWIDQAKTLKGKMFLTMERKGV